MTDEELSRIIVKLYEHHENISRNASRLNVLTNNLLDVAKFESNNSKDKGKGNIILQREKVDLVKEIDHIIDVEFSNKVREKGIKMNFINNNLGENYWVYSDKLRLNQILVNLIDNAIKFSKKDDIINIMIRDSNDFDLNLNQTELDETNHTTEEKRVGSISDDLVIEKEKRIAAKENEKKSKKKKR